jgi:hypothetical protein
MAHDDTGPGGISGEKGNKMAKLFQTAGGLYSSFPRAEDIRDIMAGGDSEESVLRTYGDRGHGEYLENCYAVIEETRATGKSAEAVLAESTVLMR